MSPYDEMIDQWLASEPGDVGVMVSKLMAQTLSPHQRQVVIRYLENLGVPVERFQPDPHRGAQAI
jgi:hypothetical protein